GDRSMVPHVSVSFPNVGYEMPPNLVSVLKQDPENDQHARTNSAIAFARAGFRVAQVEPNWKKPRNGWKSATADYETVRDRYLDAPEANVDISPDSWFVMFDVDERNGGTLEGLAELGVDVDGYQERTPGGWRIPLVMPPGISAVSSAVLATGIE